MIIDIDNKKYPIGTRVICLNGIQDGKNLKNLTGVIIGIEKNGNGYLNNNYKSDLMYYIKFDKNKLYLQQFYVFSELVEPLDLDLYEEEYKKNLKKEEELKLKHKEIDPYEEENWDD